MKSTRSGRRERHTQHAHRADTRVVKIIQVAAERLGVTAATEDAVSRVRAVVRKARQVQHVPQTALDGTIRQALALT